MRAIVGAASLGVMRLLESLGVVPDVVAGHSYGELVALHAAGVFPLEAFVELSESRGRFLKDAAGREPTPEEAMVLAETVEQVLRDLDEHELPIIELSLQGYSTQEISERLGRAERSVRRLRERVKLQLSRWQEEAGR